MVRRDRAKSQQVAEALYEHTLHAARSSGLPVLEVTDAQQRGRRFGTRLANAFADAFAQGYDHVIAVGSDCPRLHEVDWQVVVDHLDRGAPVVGPTTSRDGAYLIGLRREHFDPEVFASLPWQSSALFASLVRHLSAQAQAPPSLLASRGDVNGPHDLAALLHTHRSLPADLMERLREVLGPVEHAASVEVIVSETQVRIPLSRAPPVLRTSGCAHA